MTMNQCNVVILIVLNLITVVSPTISEIVESFDDCETNACNSLLHHNFSNKPSVILHLLPGTQYVPQHISITNIGTVEIVGNETNLLFEELGALVFKNITKLIMRNLKLLEQVAVDITMVKDILLENCYVNGKGLKSALYIANAHTVSIADCHYTTSRGGALSVKDVIHLSIKESSFKHNKTSNFVLNGTIVLENIQTAIIDNCTMINNSVNCRTKGCKGGAITSINTHQLRILNSIFKWNTAYGVNAVHGIGGAIYSEADQLEITNCQFEKNSANFGGSVYISQGSLSSSFNTYKLNQATGAGGAIYIQGHISTSMDHFNSNSANYGGAIWALTSNATSFDNHFTENNASYSGGAFFFSLAMNGFFKSSQNRFSKNKAISERGGAIYMLLTTTSATTHCLEQHQRCTDLAGIYQGEKLFSGVGVFSSFNDTYTMNTANRGSGGAIYAVTITSYIKSARFIRNQAWQQGAAISHVGNSLESIDTEFSYNNACDNSTLYINSATLVSKDCRFVSNNGSLFVVNSVIEIDGVTLFANNLGITGGAITSIQSLISFVGSGNVAITGNKAEHGGGISLFESQLNVSCSVNISKNVATHTGGGIYAYRSSISFQARKEVISMELTKNTALFGGGSYLFASTIKIFQDEFMLMSRSRLIYYNNSAVLGGALYLDQTSKIYFYRVLSAPENIFDIEFCQNIANYGGAVYISDDTASSQLCENTKKRNSDHSEADCFIQILQLGTVAVENPPSKQQYQQHDYTISLKDNVANVKGSALFGGLFDRCSLNYIAEDVTTTTEPNYYQAIYMMTFWDNKNLSSLIASNPAQVCFCTNVLNNTYNCTTTKLILSMRRGETFKIGITAIDHIQTQLAATIAATFSSNGGVGVFKNGQTRQTIEKTCTEVEYNVYSRETEVQLDIYADGPCSNKGLSKKILEVTFQPCECPIGFKPTETKTECVCDCDKELYGNVHNCSVADETLLLSMNTWIGYVNDTYNNTGFIMQTCPYDYCLVRPINISFTAPNGMDMQCAFNRANLLCGECEEGFSLVLGSSRCMICTNKFLSLMILFAFLGVLLVVFILILNMTVAAGAIHGLIFYANIIGTSQSIFFANHETDVLKVFISWLNLDFGIETCFYNGMDAYAKILLQLTFPSYLILLTITIIILCEHSQRFARLLGSRNPVATLCTLILLSYSKLLNTIIGALQFTYIHYPNGTYETVWLNDANVLYFETSHIPRFVVASIVLLLGAICTILLFFGQWLPRFSNWRLLRWSKHPKYNAFIDAYHAPFTPKHRYWVGLLLLVRIVYNLVVSLKADDSVALLSTAAAALFLILLKMLHTKTYKNWAVDFIENTFLINLIILSLGTLYIRESNNKEVPLIAISVAITFLEFLAIFFYHLYQHLLRKSKVWKKLKVLVPVRRGANLIILADYQLPQILRESDQDDTDESDDEPDQCPDYTQTEDSSATNSVRDRRYDPPIIQSALNLSELRFPYMDILDPVTPEHYKGTMKKKKSPTTPKPVTTTFVHGPRQN